MFGDSHTTNVAAGGAPVFLMLRADRTRVLLQGCEIRARRDVVDGRAIGEIGNMDCVEDESAVTCLLLRVHQMPVDQ